VHGTLVEQGQDRRADIAAPAAAAVASRAGPAEAAERAETGPTRAEARRAGAETGRKAPETAATAACPLLVHVLVVFVMLVVVMHS
jgi:hypothetical protein